MSEQQWVGIDVCQKYLDVYVRPLGNLFQVTNNEVGISKLVQTLKNIEPKLIVLEATGGMEIDAVIKLTEVKLIQFKPILTNTLNGSKSDSKKLNPKSNQQLRLMKTGSKR